MENTVKSAELYEGKIVDISKRKSKEEHKSSRREEPQESQGAGDVGQAMHDDIDDAQNSASCAQVIKIDQKQMESIINQTVQKIKPEIKSTIAVALQPVILTVVIAVIGGICGVAVYLHTEFSGIKVDIASLQKDVSQIQEDVSELDTEVEKISNYLYKNNGVEDQLEEMHKILNTSPINTTVGISDSISELSLERNDVNVVTASISPDTCLGSDSDGNEYIAQDFVGQTVFLTYKEGSSEVYFRGQYNENYHWDGYCVTNVYDSAGTLAGICESNFDNGKCVDYKSFYPTETGGQWIYTDRVCTETGNTGISVQYSFSYDKVKNFTSTNARITDFLYADKFITANSMTYVSYYSGKTSKGVFNDTTGNAYEVLYYEDGTVRTLYKGRFVDGNFEDSTEDAWDIAYSEDEKAYFYNTGQFENNSAVNKSNKSLSVEEIQSIIEPYNFDCELKWRQ